MAPIASVKLQMCDRVEGPCQQLEIGTDSRGWIQTPAGEALAGSCGGRDSIKQWLHPESGLPQRMPSCCDGSVVWL